MIGDRERMPSKGLEESEVFELEARRAFLKNCAKYAAATPPAISLLLSVGNAKAHIVSSADPQCSGPAGTSNKHCPQYTGDLVHGPDPIFVIPRRAGGALGMVHVHPGAFVQRNRLFDGLRPVGASVAAFQAQQLDAMDDAGLAIHAHRNAA